MPYTPDTWANNDPTTPLNATRLTKLAGQYPQVMADLPAKVADSGDPIGAALSTTFAGVDSVYSKSAADAKRESGALAKNVLENGVAGNGTTADQAAINALIASLPAGGEVLIPPTASGYRVTRGTVGQQRGAIQVSRPDVRINGRGAKLVLDDNDTFIRVSTAYTRQAVITANTTLTDRTLTVDTSATLSVGQKVFIKIGQAAYDTGEPESWMIATVTAIPSGTSVTIDRPINFALTVASVTNQNHRALYSLPSTGLVENVRVQDFRLHNPATGAATAEGGVVVNLARNVHIDNITAYNAGYGAVACQYVDGLQIGQVVVDRAEKQGSASKGRAMGFSESRNVRVNSLIARDCFGTVVVSEAKSDVWLGSVLFDNSLESTDRPTTQPVLHALGNGKIHVEKLHVLGNRALIAEGVPGSVSIGDLTIETTTEANVPSLSIIRNRLIARGYIYSEIKKYARTQAITTGMSNVLVPLPAGLVRRIRVYVSSLAGITSMYLTNLTSVTGSILGLLTAGQTNDLTWNNALTAIGPDGTWNAYEPKGLRISTDGAAPAGTLSIEIEYYAARGVSEASNARIDVSA